MCDLSDLEIFKMTAKRPGDIQFIYGPSLGAHIIWTRTHPFPGARLMGWMTMSIATPQSHTTSRWYFKQIETLFITL